MPQPPGHLGRGRVHGRDGCVRRGQTFAYGWHDSPVGLLAWMTQKFHEPSRAARDLPGAVAADIGAFFAKLR